MGGLLLVPVFGGSFVAWQMGLLLLYGLAAQGVGLAWGKAGILPLGNALFFGLGAYGSAAILALTDGAFLPSFLGMLGISTGLAAVAFGLGALMFRGRAGSGPSFSLMTLALVLIAAQIAESTPALTGGFNGFSGFPSLAGLNPFGTLYTLIVAVTAVVAAALLFLNQTPLGLLLRGLGDDEARLQVLGFATATIKAGVFAAAAFITTLAGALFASHQGIVTPEALGFLLSAELVIWAAVGGRMHPLGPLLGAVAIGWISAELRDSFLWWELALAAIFLIVVLFIPNGAVALASGLVRSVNLPVAHLSRPTQRTPQSLAPRSRAKDKNAPVVFDKVGAQAGGVRILTDLTLTLPAAGFVCLIGPNGAGKTSVLNALTGHLPISAGTIRIGGRDLRRAPPWHMVDRGLARKMQVPTVFETLTVRENLRLALFSGRLSWRTWLDRTTFGWSSSALDAILNHPQVLLRNALDTPAGKLSQGHRQQLELAMTLASEPSLVLLDEPAAGLSPEETQLMVELIATYVTQARATALIIEHDMALVEALKCHVIVIHQGSVLAEGTFDEIRTNPDVAQVYAGTHK